MTQEPTSFPMGFAGQRQSYAWLVFFVVFVPFVVNSFCQIRAKEDDMAWLSRFVFSLIFVLPAPLFAAVPLTINYQGRVLAPDGSPAPGPVDIKLGIFDSATAGTRLYEEQHQNTELADGIFDVLLGAGTDRVGTLDADTFMATERWLELSINGETLSPRQPFSSVSYAFQAQRAERAVSADKIGSLTAAELVPRAGGTFTGVVGLNGPNGKGNILLSYLTANPDHGFFSVQNADGVSRADVFVDANGHGLLRAANADGMYGALVTTGTEGGLITASNAVGSALLSATASSGAFFAASRGGTTGTLVSTVSSGAGSIALFGNQRGKINVLLGSEDTDPNRGSVAVLDSSLMPKAGMRINSSNRGQLFADVKNFVVDHPTRPGMQIVYASLEGPEAAIYHRGTVRLSNGRAIIELPEHFAVMAAPGTLTVQLTPESLDSQGLGFHRIDDAHLEVGELHGGQGSYPVHFVVHAVRRGYEDYRPVVGGDAVLGAGGAAGGQNDAATPVLRAGIAEATTAAHEAAQRSLR